MLQGVARVAGAYLGSFHVNRFINSIFIQQQTKPRGKKSIYSIESVVAEVVHGQLLIMNSFVSRGLESDVRPAVWQLKLCWNWVMEPDNDPAANQTKAGKGQETSFKSRPKARQSLYEPCWLVHVKYTQWCLTAAWCCWSSTFPKCVNCYF